LEYGSPIKPRFPETILLHYLDDIDSKMEAVRAVLEADPWSSELWTARIQSLESQVLDTRKFLGNVSMTDAAHR